MSTRVLLALAVTGIVLSLFGVYHYRETIDYQPTLSESNNPYDNAIFASCTIDNYEPNVTLFPPISGQVTNVLVTPGQAVKKDTALLIIDTQEQSQVVARNLALSLQENEDLARARQELEKIKSAVVSSVLTNTTALENAQKIVDFATEKANVAIAQYDLSKDLLEKATVKSPTDGIILQIANIGDYVFSKNNLDTKINLPIVQMSVFSPYVMVKCFINEDLVPDLQLTNKPEATLIFHGGNYEPLPLEFVRIDPYIIPSPELSNEKTAGTRVLPILFRLQKPVNYNIFPGQSVDVYIKK